MARRAIEAYESAGSVHLALRHWGEEEWRPTEPQVGQLLTCSVGLPDDLTATDLEHLGVDDVGRVLAERENALVFDARHAVTTEVPDLQGPPAAVRRALGQVLRTVSVRARRSRSSSVGRLAAACWRRGYGSKCDASARASSSASSSRARYDPIDPSRLWLHVRVTAQVQPTDPDAPARDRPR